MIYDVSGNPLYSSGGGSYFLVGAVLDANSESDRFGAMKELFDIGKKRMADPNVVISDSEFTKATKGAVCALPVYPSAMYEKYPTTMLYSKNADVQDVPASVTKVMSLVTGMDYLSTFGDVITINSSDVAVGSGNYFASGDTMTMQEVILSMLLPSSNTAAQAFARICGSKMLEAAGITTYTDAECRTEFISKMNAKASYLGMSNSVWTTASGLTNNNKTTANDLIKLLLEACSYPEILKCWNKKSYTISIGGTDPRTQQLTTTVTNNALESSYYIVGGKTGSYSSAEALVMVAEPK